MIESKINDLMTLPRVHGRRSLLKGCLLATFTALITKSTVAAPLAVDRNGPATDISRARHSYSKGGQSDNQSRSLDAFDVSQLLLRERLARETHDYDEEEACFYPNANVEVSWFKGTADEFIDSGRQTGPAENDEKSVYFDSIGPASIVVHGDRAIADSACAIHTFLPLDGVEASMTSYTRLLCRVQKAGDVWRIAALRAIYIRDQLEACNPAEVPRIDLDKLKLYRPSYRHLSYVLQANGRPMRSDLPGIDRPDMVAALRAAERKWLYETDLFDENIRD